MTNVTHSFRLAATRTLWLLTIGTAVALTAASCHDDDSPQLSRLTTTTRNPMLTMYIEDAEGKDMLAEGLPVSVLLNSTQQPQPFEVSATPQTLPWGGSGHVLTFAPAEPYHSPVDAQYVYTLNPLTTVVIGDCMPITVMRVFDCDLRRQSDGDGGMMTDAIFWPTQTTVMDCEVDTDTLRLVMESGWPYLRIDRDELVVEMRFDAVSDSLTALPLTTDANGMFTMGQWLSFRLLHTGFVISRPEPTVTVRNVVPSSPGAQRYLSVCVSLRLPYIYSGNRYDEQQFFYDYLIASPLLFGDANERSIYVALHKSWWQRGIQLTNLHIDDMDVNLSDYESDPTHLVVDWRGKTTDQQHEED